MDYNNPSHYIKDLTFGDEARSKIITGAEKLAKAVKSTLGASGKRVIYEDARGNPVITKDGVTVAESVVLYDPVENMGATLIKEAAKKTVREAGDGTTTATVLAEALIKEVTLAQDNGISVRDITDGVNIGLNKVTTYLDLVAIPVEGTMLSSVSAISCNNDLALGSIIAEAYEKVGKDGVVLMEDSDTEDTYVEIVEGTQMDSGLTSPHFATNAEKNKSELDNPLVLIIESEIPNIRKIQVVLEHIIKNNRSLLIIAPVSQQVKSALLMNMVKGVIKVNIIDPPGFGQGKSDVTKDLAALTGATAINEELGDDLDLITVEVLGEAEKAVTDSSSTILTIMPEFANQEERLAEIIAIKDEEKNPFLKKKLEERMAMLDGAVGIINVGAGSKVELKEKKDRVEDAIYATKAALKEGIVAGGGSALLHAARKFTPESKGEALLYKAIMSPFLTVLDNAGIKDYTNPVLETDGVDAISGKTVNMIEQGIIDPVLVTKTALKNAVSVALTIVSADCVISNIRTNESN